MLSDHLSARPILSPYTSILLPPFIYHDTDVKPARALLMQDILNTVNRYFLCFLTTFLRAHNFANLWRLLSYLFRLAGILHDLLQQALTALSGARH